MGDGGLRVMATWDLGGGEMRRRGRLRIGERVDAVGEGARERARRLEGVEGGRGDQFTRVVASESVGDKDRWGSRSSSIDSGNRVSFVCLVSTRSGSAFALSRTGLGVALRFGCATSLGLLAVVWF